MAAAMTVDPVRAKRAQIARLVAVGSRVGYTSLAVAIVAFFVGVATGPSPISSGIVVAGLALATVTLAPAIVFGYAVKAAEREDREAGR